MQWSDDTSRRENNTHVVPQSSEPTNSPCLNIVRSTEVALVDFLRAGWGVSFTGEGGCCGLAVVATCLATLFDSDLVCVLAALFNQEAKPDMVGGLVEVEWVKQG